MSELGSEEKTRLMIGIFRQGGDLLFWLKVFGGWQVKVRLASEG
jgi:hypothetical protein